MNVHHIAQRLITYQNNVGDKFKRIIRIKVLRDKI